MMVEGKCIFLMGPDILKTIFFGNLAWLIDLVMIPYLVFMTERCLLFIFYVVFKKRFFFHFADNI